MTRKRIVLGMIVAVLACSAVTLGGCSIVVGEAANRAADVAEQAADDARAQSCYAYQRMVEGAAHLYEIETGGFPTDISSLVPKYAPEAPQCASGGAYSLAVKGDKPVCTCSVHGHYAVNGE